MGEGCYITLFSPSDVIAFHRIDIGNLFESRVPVMVSEFGCDSPTKRYPDVDPLVL